MADAFAAPAASTVPTRARGGETAPGPSPAPTPTTGSPVLTASDLQARRVAVEGRVLVDGDAGHDAARGVHNLAFDRRLVAVKRRVDPENALRGDHNILRA